MNKSDNRNNKRKLEDDEANGDRTERPQKKIVKDTNNMNGFNKLLQKSKSKPEMKKETVTEVKQLQNKTVPKVEPKKVEKEIEKDIKPLSKKIDLKSESKANKTIILEDRNDMKNQKLGDDDMDKDIDDDDLPKFKKTSFVDFMTATTSELFTTTPFDNKLQVFSAIQKMGKKVMTQIQSMAIPVILEGKSIALQAKTGSGKSLAYLVPIIERLILKKKSNPSMKFASVLIVVPVKELIYQVRKDIEDLLQSHQHLNIQISEITGGVGGKSKDFSKIDIIIANPGRLLFFMEDFKNSQRIFQNVFSCVLDEADELMSLGFHQHVTNILDSLPVGAQRIFCSATFNNKVISVIPNYSTLLKISALCKDDSNVTADTLDNYYVITKSGEFHATMIAILEKYRNKKVMLFASQKRVALFYEKLLNHFKIQNTLMIGGMATSKRKESYLNFKSCETGVLITSDVSARGVDMNNVDLVFMAGLPSSTEIFIHRSGRTARIGKSGECILLLPEFLQNYVNQLKTVKFKDQLTSESFVSKSTILKQYGSGDRFMKEMMKSSQEHNSNSVQQFFYKVATVQLNTISRSTAGKPEYILAEYRKFCQNDYGLESIPRRIVKQVKQHLLDQYFFDRNGY